MTFRSKSRFSVFSIPKSCKIEPTRFSHWNALGIQVRLTCQYSEVSFLEPGGSFLGSWMTILINQWSTGTTLVVQTWILSILGVFWDPLGCQFGDLLETNLWSWMPQWHVELESCFLIDFARQNDLLWEVGCLEKSLNSLVFNRFHVYRKIELWVSRDCFLESCWDVFGTLGVTFGCLWGCRNIVGNTSKFWTPLGTLGSEGTWSVGG